MISYLPAQELHTDLEIRTLKGWRRVTAVDRLRHRVRVTIDTGLQMMFPAHHMFRCREAMTVTHINGIAVGNTVEHNGCIGTLTGDVRGLTDEDDNRGAEVRVSFEHGNEWLPLECIGNGERLVTER